MSAIREWLEKNIDDLKADRKATVERCMKELGMAERSVTDMIPKVLNGNTGGSVSGMKTLTMDALVQQHDKVGEVLSIIKGLDSGQFVDDDDVRQEVGLGAERWRRVRGSTRLAGYWYQTPSRQTVWGSKQSIAALAERMKELM